MSRTSELVAVPSSFAGSSIPRAEVAGLALLARQVESLDTKWEDVDPLRLLPANVFVPGGRLSSSHECPVRPGVRGLGFQCCCRIGLSLFTISTRCQR